MRKNIQLIVKRIPIVENSLESAKQQRKREVTKNSAYLGERKGRRLSFRTFVWNIAHWYNIFSLSMS